MDFNPLAAGLTAPFFATYLYTILSSYGILLSLWQKADIESDKATADDSHTRFDFIVVGGGSAGGLVSHRLSKNYDVLLLEAGGEPNPLTRIMGIQGFLINYPESDWNHRTVPQKYACLIAKNRQCSFNAGIGLGGTGNLNAAVHMRGHSKDYENWGNLTEDASWNFDGVLPYFKSYEHFAVENDSKVDMNFHGTGGDLQVERPEFTGLSDVFTSAAGELGYPTVDLNGGRFSDGFDSTTFSTKKGARQVSFAAFIDPARQKHDLNIRKFSLVTKIIIENNIAKGVEYIRHGKTYKVFARNEIILTAGTFGTPKLLMLSGIGPKNHLNELGIQVIKDLPVGRRFMDHVATELGPFFVDMPPIPVPDAKEFQKWITEGKGILAATHLRATGLVTSSLAKSNGEEGWPDIQFFLAQGPAYENVIEALAKSLEIKLEELKSYFGHPDNPTGKSSFSILVSLARPKSQGYVELGGTSVYDKLIIDPNYLNPNVENGTDGKVILEGVRIAMKMVENTTAFKNLGAVFTNASLPGCGHLSFKSDEYFQCYISRFTRTLHHFCGTAAMGKTGDPNAVVDTTLKVQGIKGLRIADGSVFPSMVVSNSQAPILMVAERVSKMITKDYEMPIKTELALDTPRGRPGFRFTAIGIFLALAGIVIIFLMLAIPIHNFLKYRTCPK